MEELKIEKINGYKKNLGVQSLLTISFANFSVGAVIIFAMALLAVTTTNLEEVWYIILETSFIIAGILLLIATIIVLAKESRKNIISILLITIPIFSAILPMIPLQMNFVNFKDHFPLAEMYPHFKDQMWKEASYLLESSFLIIAAFILLVIIKIVQKEVQSNYPLLIIGSISLLLILPLQIIGLVISKIDNTYEIGFKIYWGTIMGFAIISLPIFYYMIKEIKNKSVKKIIKINQVEKDFEKSFTQSFDLLLENQSKMMIIFGSLCVITSMFWLIFQGTNEQLIYYRSSNVPYSAFPQFALYGIGTVIIAYNLKEWYKVKRKQLIPIIIAIIGIAIIIPAKTLSIYISWKWGAENIFYTIFGWNSKIKPFMIILTDLLPIAVSLLCICIAKWQMINNKMKNVWLIIIPSLTFLVTIIFLSIISWRLWGDTIFNLENFYGLFVISITISIIEIAFLITIMLFDLKINKMKNNIKS